MFENLLHGDLGAPHQIFKTFILDGDGGFDLLKRRLDGGDTAGQRAVDVQHLAQLAFMDHQPRAACQVTIVARKEGHEGRAGRIDRGLSQEDEVPFGLQVAVIAHILAHHARNFRVSAQGGQFDNDQPPFGRLRQLLAEAVVHVVIDRT